MDNIKVLDKTFAISIPESRIKERVAELGAAISRDLEGKNPIFL